MLLGYPRPSEWYHPITDPSIPPAELCARFNLWQAGYYTHGDPVKDGPEALETRTSATDTSSTMSRLSVADLADSVYGPPMEPSGSDRLLIEACMTHGTWGDLKDAALYLPGAEREASADDWRGVDVRVAWCDRSVWEMLLGSYLLEKELAEARQAGKSPREVTFVRVKGANHFVSVPAWPIGRSVHDGILTMYSATGALGHAGETFESIPRRRGDRLARHSKPRQ